MELKKNNKSFDKSLFVQHLETPLLNSYDVNYEMGRGTYSKIYEVRHKATGEIRACKYIDKRDFQKEDLTRFKDEIEILRKFDHPNIIKLYEFFETPKSFYLIMEKCNGGNLTYKIEEKINTKIIFDEVVLSEIFRQIVSAIDFCHNQNICHRDLKPDNICFLNLGDMKNNFVKIIDFGFGRVIEPKRKIKSKVGTLLYMAPEVLNDEYNKKCDIWSLGVILYFILIGKPPFFGNIDAEIIAKINSMKYNTSSDEEWKNISNEAKDLIGHMLVKEDERFSAQEVLNHPWIKKEKEFPMNSAVNERQFRIYEKMDNFEKKIITFIASRLNDNEINNIKTFFVAFDKNNDGRISFEEFYNGIKKIPSIKMEKEEIQKIFDTIDTNENKEIEYTEFISSCINENIYLQKDKLQEVFLALDRKKIGKISVNDISSVLDLNVESSQKLNQLFSSLSIDEDGKIDLEEFIKMISKIISKTLNKL